eukprot:CAMPEP_0206280284 /NCGR_PEP_ID=MMETSP0047_2-20121206/38493_1 /ASSEMBLY_ACC=CAM_ASM_000192 /TAXON_ID=195065 /ORGANISM="Chroomonas mesostigmatica_cf, Strain CCMP1168" /LENGTH=232 /DNA_ID=CAMNT_0053710329 /DNA_START=152 /DNA_END=850 /DNA_ORIENTATION=+
MDPSLLDSYLEMQPATPKLRAKPDQGAQMSPLFGPRDGPSGDTAPEWHAIEASLTTTASRNRQTLSDLHLDSLPNDVNCTLEGEGEWNGARRKDSAGFAKVCGSLLGGMVKNKNSKPLGALARKRCSLTEWERSASASGQTCAASFDLAENTVLGDGGTVGAELPTLQKVHSAPGQTLQSPKDIERAERLKMVCSDLFSPKVSPDEPCLPLAPSGATGFELDFQLRRFLSQC